MAIDDTRDTEVPYEYRTEFIRTSNTKKFEESRSAAGSKDR